MYLHTYICNILYIIFISVPIIREVYDFFRDHEDCGIGSDFHKRYLKADKGSQLANFLTRVLKRIDFVARKNSISQVVPDKWEELAMCSSVSIRDTVKDCDVIVNADQTFVKMYMERDYVLAPRGTKRVGGKVTPADKKKGFTVMVTVDMLANEVLPPFIVFTGTKKDTAKRPERTLDHL